MNKITEFLDNASRSYYNGEPTISDQQFDQLAELVNYSNVGSKQHDNVEKHFVPMYSLQKYYEDKGRENPLVAHKDVTMTPKLDGAALSLLYVNGTLVRALTRGDGIEGRIVTDKFLATNLVPKHIHTLKGIIQITGEIAAGKHVENSRNYAAGALNLKDVAEFKTRAVQFFAYGVSPYITESFDSDMKILTKLGFNTVQDKNLQEIYPTDGVVFRINSNQTFDGMGYTAQFPKGAYALKTRSEAVVTKLLDVIWQTGKSGKVTPVAILEPVLVGDAVVSRATLNNMDFIESLGIQLGDMVGVVRAGEIIPQIVYKVEA